MMQGVTVNNPAPRTTKFAVSYKLNGERRFEFAQLQSASVEEARQP